MNRPERAGNNVPKSRPLLLSEVLRRAEGRDHVDTDRDDGKAVRRVMPSMVRTAISYPHEAALTTCAASGR
ncbi:hypothetical protein ACF07S_26840 [Streptomyces sp. NPDC016640]|uniref:hypothetical protein n=1 Tax=Streptomyces sp. NPDC016640 TaxID=3364969 RepID=UPI0036FD731F